MEILKLDMFYKVKSLHKFEEKVFLSFVSNSDYDSKLNQDRYKLIYCKLIIKIKKIERKMY
jgi:hypothetical protein